MAVKCTKSKLRPNADHIIVEVDEAGEKSLGGIIIPQSARDNTKMYTGRVRSVGPGKLNDKGERVEMEAKVGDRVLFRSYAGNQIEFEGDKYLVLTEGDILCYIE